MGTMHRSGVFKKTIGRARLVIATILGIVLGFFIGVSFPSVSLYKIRSPSSLRSAFDVSISNDQDFIVRSPDRTTNNLPKIYVPTNPRGAEMLPPGIVVSETDLYLRRLWGEPSEDLKKKPKYLVTFTVGIDQRNNIDKCVKKFSEDFQILLFHYDGWTTEWAQFEWSKNAIHVSVKKQTKWWYAKRFLHPDVVSAYEYIFIWDEDLGVEHFNSERYIQLVKKHGLEISQPGLEPNNGLTWQMTKRRGDKEGYRGDLPPCAAYALSHSLTCIIFVEIMAPVFSREAWRCVWHMIQNDLVHGWGLDFALRRCVEPAHEKIGVVDSQWIIHQVIPSLGNQVKLEDGKAPWEGVRARCKNEWAMFQKRLAAADNENLAQLGKE
ncbi:putative pentatricopeptide repeat-containing protein [Hibiscus syriacus]|uniref:Pentatricopeptide repeat-containing protein n=1 Tax=Hibiscus syriacus TaxID=106335 RepID=A0A6A2ZB24_HIBSY|nr:putative pentatricopeptide repeat-containing protein [Hibiscus syriacus]